jgi:integrase
MNSDVWVRREQQDDSLPVLRSAPLRPGFDRSDLSRYGDPSWDLSPAVFRQNARRCHVTVHFSTIESVSLRNALRELLYARLNTEVPGHRKALAPSHLRAYFNQARRFFEFVHAELGVIDLARVDQQLVDRYARQLLSQRSRQPISTGTLLLVVSDLYLYRAHLPSGGLRFQPWDGLGPFRAVGGRSTKENRTPRIPEHIITPLLTWSLRYVSQFAVDIFAAREETERLQARCVKLAHADESLTSKERRNQHRRRLAAYFNKRRREGRGVPLWGTAHNGANFRHPDTGDILPPINLLLLNQHIGIDAKAAPSLHVGLFGGVASLIDNAVRELGVELGGMDTPISILPETGKPWRPRFDFKSLVHEERMLQAAAYVLCAYLTGMRDSEVQAMQRGCLSITPSEDGLIMRHRVRSMTFKGKVAEGERAEWVTIEPVAKTIEVLHRLSHPAASAKGLDTLWPVLSPQPNGKDYVSSEIVRQLNRYRDHLNELFGTPETSVIPNGSDGKPWQITTRQFRRTMAWHIANRPFGTIAGMIQYKHASVAAFEGYSGSSKSGFRAEIERERSLGQLDDIMTYFDERQDGLSLSGPAGSRVSKELDRVAAEAGPLPAMIADRARLRTMLASLARTLHVGELADCFFDPNTAVCLKQAAHNERQAPVIPLCQPTRCPNACFTGRHRAVWARSAEEIKVLLAEKRLSPLQRTSLEQDLHRINDVLHSIEGIVRLEPSESFQGST